MKKLINYLFDKKISGYGLSIFRIAYSTVLLCEIVQFYYFRHLIFDKIPYLLPAEINFGIPIVIWALSVVFIIFGLFTRMATIINYLMSLALIGSINSYEYHMFYTYMSINFLLIFLPVSKNISLDRLLIKLKYSNTKFAYNPPIDVPIIAYYAPLLVGIGLVYFDSILFKYTSSFWTNGLGLWLPSSVPQTAYFTIEGLLDRKEIVIFLGYLTLIFETIFLFVFFRKKWRVPVLIVGIGMHLGILICYPIPWFALGMCAIYLLMIPVSFWDRFFKLSSSEYKMIFYYDAECPLCNRTKIVIQHFDIHSRVAFKTVQYGGEQEVLFKGITMGSLLNDIHSVKDGKLYKGLDTYIQVLSAIFYLKPISWIVRIPGIYHLGKLVYGFVAKNRTTERCVEETCGFTPPALPLDDSKFKLLQQFTLLDLKKVIGTIGLCMFILLQLIVSYNSPLVKDIRDKFGFEYTKFNRLLELASLKVESVSRVYLGITVHGVFMDYHFSEYNHILAITYVSPTGEEIWLPIINQDGTPGSYLFGPTWAKWSFRVNHNKIQQNLVPAGIRDFTAFWASRNNINLDNAEFVVKLKKIETPTSWEYGFLKRQMNRPWQNIGTVVWKNKQFEIEIPEIEKL